MALSFDQSCEVVRIQLPRSSAIDISFQELWTFISGREIFYRDIDQESLIHGYPFYRHPDFVFDRKERKIVRDGQSFPLRPTEYRALDLMAIFPNKALRSDVLALAAISYCDDPAIHTLKTHICLLRQKIKEVPADLHPIQNLVGYGYKLVEPSRLP